MSLPVLIGFAGVLVAAVTIGMLGGRCVRQPRLDLIAWTAATVGLTVALAAMSVGFASGFGSATFRAVQLFGLLLAPLWLAWGLVELVVQSEAGRFAMRLATGALTAVGGVILATDPLTAQPFGKSWPVAGLHYQTISHYVLDLVQFLALVTALACLGVAAVRARNDLRWLAPLTSGAVVGLAVLLTDAMRFSLPARSTYPLLGMMAAGLVWFGGTRLQDLPGRAGRAARADQGDLGDRARLDDGAGDGYAPPERYEGNGHGRWDPQAIPGSVRPYAPAGPEGWAGGPGGLADRGRRDWYAGGSAEPDPDGRPLAPHGMEAAPPPASAGAAAGLAGADGEFGQYGQAAAGRPGRPYGRIVIFTLLEDRVADFDRLAEQTAEEVRTAEPDALVYVIHLVPNAPMQRIFYEIYRDRDAFDAHENQPYMQRFVAERRSCVLATNVIELRLKYAKVAPLPHSQPAEPLPPPPTPPGMPGQPVPRPPAALPPLPAGRSAAWSPGHVQTLEPLPPGPDRRRLPPAGRPYDGP
jgi:quinol monooxygenase YgiN